MIFTKTMRLEVLSWEKLTHRETQGRIVSLDQLHLGVKEQLLIFSVSCLSPRRVKKLQKFINFCLKVGHSSNLKHSKSTWRQSSCNSCEMYKISTSQNRNDLRQLSFWHDMQYGELYTWKLLLPILVSMLTLAMVLSSESQIRAAAQRSVQIVRPLNSLRLNSPEVTVNFPL